MDLPPWIQNILIGAASAIIGAILSRRLYGATAGEKEASAVKLLTDALKDVLQQLRIAEKEIPAWKQKITEVEAERDTHAKMAAQLEEMLSEANATIAEMKDREPLGAETASLIRKSAAIILEDAKHLSYLADKDEPESEVAQRFRRMKEAAADITAIDVEM